MFRAKDNTFTDGNVAYPYLPDRFLVTGEVFPELEEFHSRWSRASAESFSTDQIPEGPFDVPVARVA